MDERFLQWYVSTHDKELALVLCAINGMSYSAICDTLYEKRDYPFDIEEEDAE